MSVDITRAPAKAIGTYRAYTHHSTQKISYIKQQKIVYRWFGDSQCCQPYMTLEILLRGLGALLLAEGEARI